MMNPSMLDYVNTVTNGIDYSFITTCNQCNDSTYYVNDMDLYSV